MGVEMPAAEKISLQDLNPPRRRGTGLRQKDDGVGLTVMTTMAVGSKPLDLNREKYRCRTYTPQRRHGSFHLLKDDGVGSMVMITVAVGSMTSAS
jgi:hypothetical protein